MREGMIEQRLAQQNESYRGSGGRSEENRDYGFRPAFFDYASQRLYLSRFADGKPAPMHLLDGLPDDVVVDRAASGRVLRTRASLVAGFERKGMFYTRKAAARAVAALRSRRAFRPDEKRRVLP